jgi:hypothetical protein
MAEADWDFGCFGMQLTDGVLNENDELGHPRKSDSASTLIMKTSVAPCPRPAPRSSGNSASPLPTPPAQFGFLGTMGSSCKLAPSPCSSLPRPFLSRLLNRKRPSKRKLLPEHNPLSILSTPGRTGSRRCGRASRQVG